MRKVVVDMVNNNKSLDRSVNQYVKQDDVMSVQKIACKSTGKASYLF